MPIQVVYPQTLVVVSPGDAFGHLVVNDASALVVGAEGYLYHQTKDPIFVKVVDITGNTLTVTFNSVVLDTSAYGPASGADIHFDHQAVDSAVVPPAPGVGINIAAGTNTASSGTVNFVNSNGVTFGLNTNNAMTLSVVAGAAGIGAAAAGTQTMTSGTLAFANSNNVSFTMNGSSQIVASASFAGGAATVFSNSNNVTFGLNGSTVTASATWPAQSNQPVAVSGSNGSFAFSTLTMGNSNGMTFYTTNGSVVGSYTVPTVPGATVFSNSNNVTFGLNGSTVTASATVTYPAQTVQPVAASASNGSYNFSTIKFVEGSGVTWATQANGIQASVKTDYQSSNANYLTSQSNQAISGSNGSSTFQTLSLGSTSGLNLFLSNGSIVGTYTVPTIPGATVFSNSNNVTFGLNGSTVTASASYSQPGATVFSNSNNVTFGLNGSTVTASVTVTYPSQTVQPVAASASNGSYNFSTLKFVEGSGVTWATQINGIQASVKTDYQSSNANYQTGHTGPTGVRVNASASTLTNGDLVFSNSNNITFGINGSTITASASVIAQTQQPMYFSAGTTSTSANTLQFGTSAANGNVTFAISGGSLVGSAPSGGAGFTAGISTNGSGTTGTVNSQIVFFPGANITLSQSINGASASLTVIGGAGGAGVNVAGGGVTQGTGTVNFANSNNVSFGLSNNGTMTASASFNQNVQPVAASGSNGSFAFSTLTMGNSNGLTFYTTNGSMVGSYTVPTIPGATVFSNSNNVTFGLNGSTVTATATFPAQTVQPVAVSGSNGSFLFSTLTMGNSNGLTFYTTNGSMVGSYTVPTIPGATVFSNSNNVTFGLNGSTVTATATFPAQTVQPVAASASNGSFNFSTIKFVEGSGVTWATQAGGIQASVKTDYQSSNANYLTSQSNQAVSGTNGSVTFQTLSFTAANGASFYTSANSAIALSYTVPNVPAQTQQPMYFSAGTTSTSANTLQFGSSAANGNVTFAISGGSVVGSVPAIPGATVFSNSNNVTFGLNGSTVTATATFAQSQQPVYFSAGTTSTSANTLQFGTSAANGNVTFAISGGSVVGSAPSGGAFSAGNSTDGVGTTGLVGNQLVFFPGANITLSQSLNGGSASLTVVGGAGGAGAAIAGSGTYTQNTGTITFQNSNNVTFGLSNNGVMTASASFGGGGAALKGSGTYTQNTGTIEFGNSNGITFGLSNNGTMTASYDLTQLTVGGNISLSNNGSTITLNGQAVAMAFNAATTQTSGTVVFSNSNGISWGYNVNTVTAQLTRNISAVGNTAGQSSSSSYNASAQSFSGMGAISVGNSGGAIIFSANSTYNLSAVGNTTGQSSSSSYNYSGHLFSGAGAISVGNSGGSFIISANSTRNLYAVGNTTGQSSSSSYGLASHSFSGAGIVSVGNSGGSFIISATQSAQTGNLYAVGNTTGQSSSSNYDLRSLSFSGAGGISIGNSGGSFIISQLGGGVALSAAGTGAGGSNSQSSGTVNFSNSNNVTFGLSNNGVMTASFNAANTASTFQAGMSTFGNTAGTTGLVQNNIVFVGTNGISLSQSVNGASATLTFDVSNYSLRRYPESPVPLATSSMYTGAYGNTGGNSQTTASFYICPLILPHPIAFDEIEIYVSNGSVGASNSTWQHTIAHMLGIYTLDTAGGTTALRSVSTFQAMMQLTGSSNSAITGLVYWGTNSTATNATTGFTGNSTAVITGMKNIKFYDQPATLPAGQYWLAHGFTQRTSNVNMFSQANTALYMSYSQTTGAPYLGQVTTATPSPYRYMGLFTFQGTTNAGTAPMVPVSIDTTAITGTGGSSQMRWLAPNIYK